MDATLDRYADLPAFRHLQNYGDLHRPNMNARSPSSSRSNVRRIRHPAGLRFGWPDAGHPAGAALHSSSWTWRRFWYCSPW